MLGDVPVLGKLFQSKSRLRNNTELLVLVTPELVTPDVTNQPAPGMNYPKPLEWPRAISKDEAVPVTKETSATGAVPFETLMNRVEPQAPDNSKPPVYNPATATAGGALSPR